MKLTAEARLREMEHLNSVQADNVRRERERAQSAESQIAALRGLAGEWVPVSERKPPRGVPVLIAWSENTALGAVAKFGGKRWIDPHGQEDFAPPKYWMPIPPLAAQPPVEPRLQPATESTK